MNRGSIVSVALQGDFGKPRPALIIQSDFFKGHSSITILPVTGHIIDAPLLRITLNESNSTGLQKTSQVMIDKISTVPFDKIGESFGWVNKATLIEIDRCLAVFLGISD